VKRVLGHKKIIGLLCGWAVSGGISAAVLDITIQNVIPQQGQLLITVHNALETWRSDEDFNSPQFQAFQYKVIPATDAQMTVQFEDIPAGKYAVAVVQDKNMDKKMNRAMHPKYGLPDEPYGLSRGAWSWFRKGNFHEASFEIKEPGAELTIELKEHRQRIFGK
jgi:uncharacterized protein (DUF2141 family)